jgi:hypothetical protein
MTTKETFLQLGAGSSHHETAERIDFNGLDELVAMCIYSYITRRGKDVVKRELATDALSETTTLLTRMIDVGTVHFLSQNKLISASEEDNNELAITTALGINISLASVLKEMGVNDHGSNIFFSIDSLYALVERAEEFIKNSLLEEGYVFSLVAANLMTLIYGETIE